MKDLGIRKFFGCSFVEIDGVSYEFIVGDKLLLFYLKVDEINIMFVLNYKLDVEFGI